MQKSQKTGIQSLDRQDPLEEEMATHSSILGWRIPWTVDPWTVDPWTGCSPWDHKGLDTTEQLSANIFLHGLIIIGSFSTLKMSVLLECSKGEK